jgi:hypothetical protein
MTDPMSVDDLRAAMRAGRLSLDSKVARQGDPAWRQLREVLGAASAERSIPTGAVGAADVWAKATTIGSLLTVVAVATVGLLGWKLHEADEATTKADLASLRADLAAIKDAVDKGAAGTWVRGKETVQDCVATNQLFQCTVTNITDQPLSACWIGVLGQKKGGGSMRSFPLCTGRVGARETRVVSTPWERGAASDICNKVSAFGNSVLDWDACDFTYESIDPKEGVTTAAVAPRAPAATNQP